MTSSSAGSSSVEQPAGVGLTKDRHPVSVTEVRMASAGIAHRKQRADTVHIIKHYIINTEQSR
jgi:hypothetical protein